MDASRYNSPSRKSRFRAQGPSSHRPAAPVDEPAPEVAEDAPLDAPAETYQDEPSAEVAAPDEVYADEPFPEAHADEPVPAETYPDEDSLPAGLRLTRESGHSSSLAESRSIWPTVLIALLCLLAGVVGGFFLHRQKPDAIPALSRPATQAKPSPILPLNPAVLKEIDESFEANKQGHFADARQHFTVLADRNTVWPSMRIEAARAALYEHDFDGAEKILTTMTRAGANADAEFLTGLLQMTLQTYEKSEAAFGRAVALDPSRPDIFYFWGECLRRQGKPQDAAEKFHEALIRNQYETTEGLYQLKLWLSEIQADQESVKGSNAKIDSDLVSGHPSGPALFAAAARNMKTGQFKEAGERVAQAQKVMEPAVFRVILQDPLFLQEAYRPELAPFYKP